MGSRTTALSRKLRQVRFLPSEYGSFRKDIIDFFLEELLPSCKVLADPMAGNSWLVPVVEKYGLVAYFNDIMPFYYYLNKAKTYRFYCALKNANALEKTFLYQEALSCLSLLKNKKLVVSEDWIHSEILNGLIEGWNRSGGYKSPIKEILRAIIVLCIRPYSNCTKSETNYPWLKVGGMSTELTLSRVVRRALKIFRTYYFLHYTEVDMNCKGRCYFTRKDANSLSIKKNADVVFTSPPYCNRHEPEVTYGPELFFFRSIGECVNTRNIVGTTRVKDYNEMNTDLDFIRAVAPKTLKFLRWVKKAGIGREKSQYYLKYYTRYYGRLYSTLENILKLVGPKGRIYIGVQDNVHRGQINSVGVYVSEFLRKQDLNVRVRFKRLRTHQGLRNISAYHPIVIRRHWEYIIEGRK